MKNLMLKFAPLVVQNALITFYNTWLYYKRRSGCYWEYRKYFEGFDNASRESLEVEQRNRLDDFLQHAVKHSRYYSRFAGSTKLERFPVLEKRVLLEMLGDISTVSPVKAEVSLTGGTTGASLKVLYTREDIQERNAILDHFRAQFGYELGKRTAWFSGKDIVREKDLKKGVCYRDDWFNRIRYFSTFNINSQYFDSYWEALTKFSPEFLVGFPSSVYDICVMAKERGLSFKGVVKAFFPTAETVLPQHRRVISDVLGCPLIDQYASSEGAPFILQCSRGRLHIHPLTGIFEVVDDEFQPAREGEILVTSFSTRGTPLIRYRIGDRIKLGPEGDRCPCGSSMPLVEHIDGRSNDYILSREKGRVNLGNLSNCTKEAPGIICFQVIQEVEDSVKVKLVKGRDYREQDAVNFRNALRARLGSSIEIEIDYVCDIPREKSGKFRIVKNLLHSSPKARG